MEHHPELQEEVLEPMSPSAQYLRSSALSLTILGVLECEVPIDDSNTLTLLKDVFLPINPRFSSIMGPDTISTFSMFSGTGTAALARTVDDVDGTIRGISVTQKKGAKKWKKVEVNLKEHVTVPVFPPNMTVEYYDECFTEYLSKLAMEQLPLNRPLWEIHVLKYPTKNAAGNIVFKLHHALGDGYSLMGALLSCLQRVDNPLMPLTFPMRQPNVARKTPLLRRLPRVFTGLFHTASDFGWSLIKSSLIEDDKSPIRSGEDGVEFRPIVTTTTSFSIDQLKQIKSRLNNVTINDVITGTITLGTRLYMQKTSPGSGVAKSTALVLLNTRVIGGYKSVNEMVKPDSQVPWGNRFAFLHISVPKLTETELQNPLHFIKKAHTTIKRQKNSAAVYLTGTLLNFIRKIRGPEATARYIHATLKNTSMAISNLIGPVELMALDNQPVKGLYFAVAGPPQSLSVTMISYVGQLRIAMTVEKGFMDPNKLKSCIEYAFELICKAALESVPLPLPV